MGTKPKRDQTADSFGMSPLQEFTLQAIPVLPGTVLEPRYGRPKPVRAIDEGSSPIPASPSTSHQTVGNIGLYYVCYRLSRLGWNVMPTARNAKGIDILIYSQDGSRTRTVQVKTLSRGNPVPLSNKLDHLFADFVVVCRHIVRETPECFLLTPDEIRLLAQRRDKNGTVSYWLQPRGYAVDQFRERWERIGSGLSANAAAEGVTVPRLAGP